MPEDVINSNTNSNSENSKKDTIWVITSTESVGTRGVGEAARVKVEALADNVKIFVEQIGSILEKIPENVGNYQLDEFEISAEVTAKGSLALFGTGGEVGGTGGLKFVFKRQEKGN